MNVLIIIPLFFLILLIKYKENKLVMAPIIFYLVGSLVGYFMTLNPVYNTAINKGHQDPSLEANLFLILCLFISFIPILKAEIKEVNHIRINKTNLDIFSFILIVLSVFYISWMAPHMSDAYGSIQDFSAYKSEVSEDSLTFSKGIPIISWILSIQVALRPIIIFLFCLSFCINSSNFYKFSMGVCSILPPIIQAIATSYRNEIVFTGIGFIICFLFFRNQYSKKVKRFMGISIIGGFSAIVIFISILFAFLRFGDFGNDFFVYSLERYLGEPFVNFNTMLWGEDHLLWGNKSFVVFRKYLGMSFIVPGNLEDYQYMLGYQYNYFYSFIGDFYQDFGSVGAFGICGLITILARQCQASYLNHKQFLSLNLFNCLYITIITRSYFYFVYAGYNFFSLVFLVIGFIICRHFIFGGRQAYYLQLRNKSY